MNIPAPLCVSLFLALLLSLPADAKKIRVEAVPGIPFGVARITIPLDLGLDREQLDTRLLSVTDDAGRVLYPAIRYTQPLGFVRELLGVEQESSPSQLQVHFLFTGKRTTSCPDVVAHAANGNGGS